MTFLDRLLEPFPWVIPLLDYAEQYLGPVIVIIFFLLMLRVLYWATVVVPKRVQRLLAGLKRKGYIDVDPEDPLLALIVEKLAPMYDHHPRQGYPIPPWKIIKAVSKSHTRGTRYLIYASRTQTEFSNRGPGNTESLRSSVMVLEERRLNFSESVYLKPAESTGRSKSCASMYHLKQAAPAKRSEFFDQYAFYTKSGAMAVFPDRLIETLTSLLTLFTLQDRHHVHIWGSNLKFSQEGWGLLSSEEIYKPESMEQFLKAADKISDSLP